MNLDLSCYAAQADLELAPFDLCICGEPVDERGKTAIETLDSVSKTTLSMVYDPDRFIVRIGSHDYSIDGDEIDALLSEYRTSRIVIESTTLGFVEILVCLRCFIASPCEPISILYVEPEEYLPLSHDRKVLERRSFQLSNEFPGFKPIPRFMMMMREGVEAHGVFFLGYEGSRFDQALENLRMINPRDCEVIFGVPPYTPGWTMNAFANNIRTLKEYGISAGIGFCGADNPKAALMKLEDIHRSLPEPKRMFVSPLGTKPHGLGAAIFAAGKKDIGILYDHPTRCHDRSVGAGKFHLYILGGT